MQIIKFPESKDFGGFNERYMAALATHETYIKWQKKRLRYEKSELAPTWTNGANVISVVLQRKPVPEDMSIAINNLVGYATHQNKYIVRAWRGMKDGEWQLLAEVAEPVSG